MREKIHHEEAQYSNDDEDRRESDLEHPPHDREDRADKPRKKRKRKKHAYETYVVVFDLMTVVLTLVCGLSLWYAYRSYGLQKQVRVLTFGEVKYMIEKDGMMYKKNPRSVAMSDSYIKSKEIYKGDGKSRKFATQTAFFKYNLFGANDTSKIHKRDGRYELESGFNEALNTDVQTRFLPNPYPYALAEGVHAWNFWVSETFPVDRKSKDYKQLAKKYLKEAFEEVLSIFPKTKRLTEGEERELGKVDKRKILRKNFVIWENPQQRKSVLSVWHVQVIFDGGRIKPKLPEGDTWH